MISTAVTVYYLMIKNIPSLISVFPRFEYFLILCGLFFLPLFVVTGWAHYKWIRAFKVDAEVQAESTQYYVDSNLLYGALLCLAKRSNVDCEPEFIRIRAVLEARR
jgi:hypothetical protein